MRTQLEKLIRKINRKRVEMSKKNIGVDLDGVVFDFDTAFERWISKQGYRKVTEKEYDLHKRYSFEDRWDAITHLEKFTMRHSPFLWLQYIPGAKEGLIELGKDHNLYFITAREANEVNVRDTKKRFKVDMFNQPLIFSKDKGVKAKELGLDFLIEDSVENLIDLFANSPKTKGILIDKPYNHHYTPFRTKRVNDWKEIVRYLK